MTIGLLQAGAKGQVGNSTGKDVADTVNAITDKIGTDPEIIKAKSIHLAGLPQTAGAPEGYGNLAAVISDLADNGVIDDPVMSLEPVDFFDTRLMTEFGGFGYGVDVESSGQIIKLNLENGTKENFGVPVPVGNLQNIAFMTDGTCFAEGHNGDTVYKLYRSTDLGATWFLSNTQGIAQVWGARNRGIVQYKNMILYAEYNVNGSRVAGSTNDRLRLRKSTDNGTTWSDIVVWNTDGTTRNTRHMHGVVVSKDGESAYILTGDTNTESAVIKWDGVTAIPDNTPLTNVQAVTGLPTLSGKQAFRANDLIEEDGWLYWVSDAPNNEIFQAENAGAFKAKTDLSEWLKISDVTAADRGTAGRLGCLLPTGEIVWQCNNEDSSTGFRYSAIVVSNKSKTVWKTVGAYRGDASQSFYYRRAFFLVGDTMYMSNDYGSGKSLETSVAFRLIDREFKGDFRTEQSLDTIHPAYWVDPVNGSNSNNGWSPRTPFLTIDYALTGDRVPYGGVVQLAEGDYYVGSITPKADAATRNGDPTDYQRIQGKSAASSRLIFSSGASTSNVFNLAGTNAKRVELRNLSIGTEKHNATLITSNVASGDVSHGAKITNSFIDGNYDQRFSNTFVSNKTPIRLFGALLVVSDGVTTSQFYTRTGGTGGQAIYHVEKSAVVNGGRHFDVIGSSNSFTGVDSVFINPITEFLRVQSAAVLSAKFINCGLFTTNITAAVAVKNDSGGSLPVYFYGAYGNLPFNEQSCFDAYSINTQPYGLLVNISDYVN